LAQGRGDIAAANLTITKERLKRVDFAAPFTNQVKEVIVSAPNAPNVKKLQDLAGRTVTVRKSSSYYASLQKLNKRLSKAGKPPIIIQPAHANLETEDLLEMANANLVPLTVSDSHLANFWKGIFKNIKVHNNLAIRSGGQIAWAVRKNSPKLKAAINRFMKSHKKGTLMGNILIQKYLKKNKWARNPTAQKDLRRFRQTTALFKRFAGKYGFDWLMITALAYQESGLDQSVKSPVGAVGVMQILPSTAAGPPVNIPDVHKLDKNIQAGTKYLRFLYDKYFKKAPMDEVNKVLFTFAAYNAGPGRIISLKPRTRKLGLDPYRWFGNVEVAAARVIGRETVQYVSNILKYYLAYKQISEAGKDNKAQTKPE
jgi:membrane-bound lytic murein transglycosylase MltF